MNWSITSTARNSARAREQRIELPTSPDELADRGEEHREHREEEPEGGFPAVLAEVEQGRRHRREDETDGGE